MENKINKKVELYIEQFRENIRSKILDLDIDNAAAATVFTVTTVTQIGRPQKGDIAYSVSSGKFKGYVSLGAETSWQNLN